MQVRQTGHHRQALVSTRREHGLLRAGLHVDHVRVHARSKARLSQRALQPEADVARRAQSGRCPAHRARRGWGRGKRPAVGMGAAALADGQPRADWRVTRERERGRRRGRGG
jgi:hypothetical protein